MWRIGAVIRGVLILVGTAVVFLAVMAGILALLGHGLDVRGDSVVGDFWDARGIDSDGGDSPTAIRLAVVMAGCAGLVAVAAVRSRRH
jgi:hypothetical protein